MNNPRYAPAFNAVGTALKAHDQWLPLSVREAIALAILTAIDEHRAPAPATDRREQYAAALHAVVRRLNASEGFAYAPSNQTIWQEQADAVIAVGDREQQQLRDELEQMHAGEEPYTDEHTEATPAQWIWLWNRATPERRLEVAAQIQGAAARADRCVMGNHEGRLEHERADRAALAQLRHALPAVRRALDSLPARCRYHGEDTDPRRPSYGAEACCDTGVPAQRRRLAEQALTALANLETP